MLTPTEFWRRALEDVNFDRVESTARERGKELKAEAGVETTIGWGWLAGLCGKASFSHTTKDSEQESRAKILADPSPSHLVPLLKNLPLLLVVEDFHYLSAEAQECIFQQWKVFVDNEISVIVVSTTHHATDLAYANKDLVGRITHVDLPKWQLEDLAKIPQLGFNYLGIHYSKALSDVLAEESAGLPIIAQSACRQLLLEKGIKKFSEMREPTEYGFNKQNVYDALHKVAVTEYSQFSSLYDNLVRGPRKRARKYETYELILSSFTIDPLKFSLSRDELEDRLNELPIKEGKKPPIASVNATLAALAKFQQRQGFSLLEWIPNHRKLYIVEPSFLFYLRWKERRTSGTKASDVSNLLQLLLPGWLKEAMRASEEAQ